MAQKLEYDRSVESALKLSDRNARQGRLGPASSAIETAKRLHSKVYPPGSQLGQVHGLRIERSREVMGARRLIARLATGAYLDPGQFWRLSVATENLADISLAISDHTVGYAHPADIRAHIMSEAGATSIWQGRLTVAMLALSGDAHHRSTCAIDASDAYEQAENLVQRGNNYHYKALLFGHMTRLMVMVGADRSQELKTAWRTTFAAATKDPASFLPSLRDIGKLSRDRSRLLIESSIRRGAI